MRDFVIEPKSRVVMSEGEWAALKRDVDRAFIVRPGCDLIIIPAVLTGPEVLEFVRALCPPTREPGATG